MLTVNLFAGPGAGKSTTAAGVFHCLKAMGHPAELVTEFAKECAWEGRTGPLRCQPYMFGQQLWRIERLRDRGVNVAVTDSPILLSAVYAPDDTPASFREAVRDYAKREDALNVLLLRSKTYDPRGRFQTEAEARALDGAITAELRGVDPDFLTAPGDQRAVPFIVGQIIRRLGDPK